MLTPRLCSARAAGLFAAALACAVMIGAGGPTWAAQEAKPAVVKPANAAPPLPPKGAATIRQAQGNGGGVLLGALVTGSIFAAILLLVDGEDTGPITTTVTSE